MSRTDAPSAPQHPSSRRPRRALVLLATMAVLLAGCDIAAGETRRGEQPLMEISEQLTEAIGASSFPWTPATAEASGPIVQAKAASEEQASPVSVRISAGGTGVSLRSDCADAARAGGAWPDNTQVDVVEYGAGRCAGWTRASGSGVTSWVRDEYLQGLPPAGQRAAPAAPGVAGSPHVAQLRVWTSKLLDGAARVALLGRHSPESKEATLTATFLGTARDDLRALATEVQNGAGTGVAACDGARRPLVDGAKALADLAQRMIPTFADGADVAAGLEAIVARYAAAQAEAARLIADCARA